MLEKKFSLKKSLTREELIVIEIVNSLLNLFLFIRFYVKVSYSFFSLQGFDLYVTHNHLVSSILISFFNSIFRLGQL